MSAVSTCRLCGGSVSFKFNVKIMRRYVIGYFECSQCGSLQSENPYWLGEAYADPRPITDTGMVARTLRLSILSDFLFSILGVPPNISCVDWGGGSGLFTRLMRDKGWNFYRQDRYVTNFFAPFHDFENLKPATCGIISIFETLEHFVNPAEELDQIFACAPDIVIATTALYSGQGDRWGYLSHDSGQHVFLYSKKSLDFIGQKYNFLFITNGDFHVFIRRKPRFISISQDSVDALVQCMKSPDILMGRAICRFGEYMKAPFRQCEIDHKSIVKLLNSR